MTMQSLPFTLLPVCLLVAPGCSTDTLSRTGYETLQNIGAQQCEKDLSADCPEHESYESYRRRRDAERAGQ